MNTVSTVKKCRALAFSHPLCALLGYFVLFLLFMAPEADAFGFAGGDGSEANPYQVDTAAHLDAVRHNLDLHFVQTTNINLGSSPWNDGEGWEPIGTEDNPFTGSYDGNGFMISNLMISNLMMNNSACDRIGLFGVTGEGSEIRDLGLVDVDITVTSQDRGLDVGALVGRNQAEIANCYVTGTLTAEIDFGGMLRAGLMIGRNHGDISDSHAEGSVSATNLDRNVSGADLRRNVSVGGLVGMNGDGKEDNRDGGDILNSYASVTVVGNSDSYNVYAGGLIGRKGGGGDGAAGDVIDCYATGDVTADAADGGYAARAGGLIGRVGSSYDTDDGIVLRSYATGSVTAIGGDGAARAGGLIGQNSGWESINGQVDTCYATGDVTIIGGFYGNRVGGLIGVNFSSVYDSFAIGNVTGSPRPELEVGEGHSLFAGGLIGQQRVDDDGSMPARKVIRSFATGNVTVFDDVGVLGRGCGLAAGGLIGRNGGGGTNGATISDCYAIGNVTAQGNTDFLNNIAAGGLIGINGGNQSNGGDVINTYAVGSVVSDDIAGALIAISDNDDGETTAVEFSFANEDTNPGLDLIGSLRGDVTDFDTSRLETTLQMQQQTTFTDVGWDFINVWTVKNGETYPYLQWQPTSDIHEDEDPEDIAEDISSSGSSSSSSGCFIKTLKFGK